MLPVGVHEDLVNIHTDIGGVFGNVLNHKEFLTGETFLEELKAVFPK